MYCYPTILSYPSASLSIVQGYEQTRYPQYVNRPDTNLVPVTINSSPIQLCDMVPVPR